MSYASDMLQKYKAAEEAILAFGQTVDWEGRRLTRADLPAVQAERRALEARVAGEERAARGARGPRFSTANFSDG